MVSEDGEPIIIDFGLSGNSDPNGGTPGYIAPDCPKHEKRVFDLEEQKSADCWMLGKIVYEIIHKKRTEKEQAEWQYAGFSKIEL